MKALVFVLVSCVALIANGEEDREYELLIVNQTEAQTLSLPLAATHDSSVSLFQEKELASREVRALSEQGSYLPLEKALNQSGKNVSVTRGSAPIRPGKTMLLRLFPDAGQTKVSLLAKLMTTNDAFLGLAGESLPENGSREIVAPVFSSGTQVRNERCEFIPGSPRNHPGHSLDLQPPVPIFPLTGLSGVGDLDPKVYGWSKGVAVIQITRRH